MMRNCRKSWSRCRGLTLVEVVAGIVILGTLLVSIVITTGRLMSKSYLSSRRVEAYKVADELLAGWWEEEVPRNDSGEIEGEDDWTWRTSSREADIEGMDAEIVTLEITEAEVEKPLASIDVLVVNQEEDDDEAQEEPTTRPDAG